MRRALRISLLALLGLLLFRPAWAQFTVNVGFAPPALPVYEQPICPVDGYIWAPGYWAWDPDYQDYYWVPGTWVLAPQPGYLWTPAWWGWENGGFAFHEGYWATEVGWYGGINYGYGYWGHGFWGGRWDHDRFFYNTAVVHVNETIVRNVYIDKTVIINNNETVNRVSYNGGEGGVRERRTPQEETVARERHIPPVQMQEQHREMAHSDPHMRASANQGRPPVAATARPAEFSGRDVVAAREAGAPYHPPANRAAPGGNPGGPANMPVHARDLQPHQPAPIPENAAPQRVQKYQQQQQTLAEQQNQEHRQLQERQNMEDQQAAQRQYSQEKQQQMEQHHQQQTQQMEQRHTEQQQHLQTKQQPRPPK